METCKLKTFMDLPPEERPSAFMGFDGFIDTVGRVAHGEGRPFSSMASLGAFLSGRKENNCSLEVLRGTRRMGGNMPLCANALARLGVPVCCVGAMGPGAPEPEFEAMHGLCSLVPVARPGECLALEFQDSKLFMADMSGPRAMSWQGILEEAGLGAIVAAAGRARLLGLFNWGELPNMQGIWEGFARDVLPGLGGERRTAVFDLSDCSGRSAESIKAALTVLGEFRRHTRVVLSCNDNELAAMAKALGCLSGDAAQAGGAVYASGAMDLLVHHSLTYARVFDGRGLETVNGIHIDNPVLVTGGGDHFNAGLCLGLLAGLTAGESAMLGNTVSRIYVATGESPGPADVLEELAIHTDTCKEERA